MSYGKFDDDFMGSFESQVFDHLKSQSEEFIEKVISEDLGKISRVFDQMYDLPCISFEEFDKRLSEAESIEAYMTPIIEQSAAVLMTQDQSKVRDDVIKAIGVDRYCRLIGGENIGEDGAINIVADMAPLADGATEEEKLQYQTKQEAFREREKKLAHNILEGVLSCYSMNLIAHNKPQIAITRSTLDDLHTKLIDKIQNIEKTSGDFKRSLETKVPSYDDINESNYEEEVQKLNEEIKTALEQEPDSVKLRELEAKAKALHEKGKEISLISDFEEKEDCISLKINNISSKISSGKSSITNLQPSAPSESNSLGQLQQLNERFGQLEDAINTILGFGQIKGAVKQSLEDALIRIGDQSVTIPLYNEEGIAEQIVPTIEEEYANISYSISQAISQELAKGNLSLCSELEGVALFESSEQTNDKISKIYNYINGLSMELRTAAAKLEGSTSCKQQVEAFQKELGKLLEHNQANYQNLGEIGFQTLELHLQRATDNFLPSIQNANTYEMNVLQSVLNFITFGWAFSEEKTKQDECKQGKDSIISAFQDMKAQLQAIKESESCMQEEEPTVLYEKSMVCGF